MAGYAATSPHLARCPTLGGPLLEKDHLQELGRRDLRNSTVFAPLVATRKLTLGSMAGKSESKPSGLSLLQIGCWEALPGLRPRLFGESGIQSALEFGQLVQSEAVYMHLSAPSQGTLGSCYCEHFTSTVSLSLITGQRREVLLDGLEVKIGYRSVDAFGWV